MVVKNGDGVTVILYMKYNGIVTVISSQIVQTKEKIV